MTVAAPSNSASRPTLLGGLQTWGCLACALIFSRDRHRNSSLPGPSFKEGAALPPPTQPDEKNNTPQRRRLVWRGKEECHQGWVFATSAKKGTRFGERSAGLAPQRALQPFFNGVGGFFAGSAERGRVLGGSRCQQRVAAGASCGPSSWLCSTPALWASVGRRRAGGGGGGVRFSRIPPWRAHFARFSRVRAAMRTAPGARKVGPDDTDELRE
eukprot:gene20945-biopygen2622